MAVAAAFASSFWLYGAGRTMCETTGFTLRASLCGVLLGAGIPAVIGAAVLVVRLRDPRAITNRVLWLLLALFSGSGISEAVILRDEQNFFHETHDVQTIRSRARAWPNTLTSLVFVPGEGIHSTD